MSSPSTASFDVREDLSMTLSEFDHEMNERGYVGHRLLPATPKDDKAGKFPRVPLEEELQDHDFSRNPDGTFVRTRMEWEDDNYDTKSYGGECPLDDEVQARYDDLIDSELYEGNRIERGILRQFERQVVDYFTTVANYAVSRTKGGLTAWTKANKASATPFADIDEQREAMFMDLGQEPNALFLNRVDFRNALYTDDVVNRLKSQNYQDARPGPLNRNADALAEALDIPQVIVANALKNTGKTRNLSRIWPTGYAVLARVAVTSDPTEICIGRSPVWSPMGYVAGDQRIGVWAESYDEPQVAGSVIRRRANWGRKILHVEAARLILINGDAQPT